MTEVIGREKSFISTLREDKWWIGPLLVLFGLLSFIIYSTWAAWQGNHFWVGSEGFGGYLSPFYSPTVFIDSSTAYPAGTPHSLFGEWPDWLWWLPGHSPAWLILVFPLSFRFTCYYYRKAYYRAFTFSPPACAVGGIPQKNYKGETGILLFQNIHRYAMYFAIVFILLFCCFNLIYESVIFIINNLIVFIYISFYAI